MVIAIIILAWLGLCFGSFVNALVWRVHEQGKKHAKGKNHPNLSVISGRSICPKCNHQLAWYDLIPVFSWLALQGRCRYCKKPISWQYPAVELTTAMVFVVSYVWWPGGLYHGRDWLLFVTWLAVSVGLMALLVYDFKWMILPNKIIYPTFFIALAGRLTFIIFFADNKAHNLLLLALSLLVASGIFWLLYVISNGKWIGFGDVRLGLITGTVLADPAKSFLMIFLGSILGSIYILPAIITRKKTLTARLPFGPFLVVACMVVVLFGSDILDWYRHIFLP